MFDPGKKSQVTRLFKTWTKSRQQLRPFREKRTRMVKDYVGSNYGDNGEDRKTLINLIFQAADTYTMALAANRPRILVSSKHQELTWFSNHFQQALNNLIQEIVLEDVLYRAVLDAFFTIGIVKVFNAEDAMVQLEGEDFALDPGKPFARGISLDDWAHDMSAQRWSECSWYSDRYRVDLESLLGDPAYDQKIVKQIDPDTHYALDKEGERQVKELGNRPDEGEQATLKEWVDLWDFYLPRERLIVTYHGELKEAQRPLRVVEWDGPEHGPYHMLSLADVPDNTMPLSPAMNLRNLHDMINGMMRKLEKQAQNMKDIPIYQHGFEDDAKRLASASDGLFTAVADINAINNLKFGGADPGLQQFQLYSTDLFDRMAGNLSAMGGLSQQADTLGQERLIHGAVSKREAAMQSRTTKFAANICRDLGWLLWVDGVKVMPQQLNIGDFEVDSPWTPEYREGNFLDYNFQIEPYSMSYKSPSERIQGITNFLTQIAMPMMPFLEQQGGFIDMQEILNIYSDLMDVPRLQSIVKFEEKKPDQPGPADGNEPKQSPVTTRNYTRKNIPTGGTDESRSNVMQQVLSGRNVNPDQQRSLQQQRGM